MVSKTPKDFKKNRRNINFRGVSSMRLQSKKTGAEKIGSSRLSLHFRVFNSAKCGRQVGQAYICKT